MKKIKCINSICEAQFFFDEQKNPNADKVRCPKCKTIIPISVEDKKDDKKNSPTSLPILALIAGQSVFPLRQGSNFIGRRADNDIVLDQDQHISRRHALLEVIEKPNGGWLYILSDLQSGNGVYVESQRLRTNERIELVAGNTFTLGDTYLRLTR